jgi:glycosyltransferase involved in cell wall biosynthesis
MGDTAASSVSASNRPRRILQVNSVLTTGGTDEQCVRTVEVLRELGQDVWLIGPSDSAFSARIGASGLFTDPALRTHKFKFAWQLAQRIRELRPEIVHAHHGRDYWPTILAVWLSGMRPKIVVSRHLAKRPGSPGSHYLLLYCCDVVVCVSQFVARVLREGVNEPNSSDPERRARSPLYGDKSKITVIYPGIDTRRFRPMADSPMRGLWHLKPEQFVFAVVGVYDLPRGKGQRDFLEAAAKVHHLIPEARFLIIGRGTLAETLRSDIARLGLDGKAFLTPYCSDMPEAMNAIDCLVHPAVGTEAFPLVMSEAQACGRPVIGSNLDGIPETIIDPSSGSLFPPGDVNALADQMLLWARQPRWDLERRRRLHEAVDNKLSLRAAGDKLCALYFEITPSAL